MSNSITTKKAVAWFMMIHFHHSLYHFDSVNLWYQCRSLSAAPAAPSGRSTQGARSLPSFPTSTHLSANQQENALDAELYRAAELDSDWSADKKSYLWIFSLGQVPSPGRVMVLMCLCVYLFVCLSVPPPMIQIYTWTIFTHNSDLHINSIHP